MGVILKMTLKLTDRSAKEMKIAEELQSHSCKSGFIKDVLWAHMVEAEHPKRSEPALPDFTF